MKVERRTSLKKKKEAVPQCMKSGDNSTSAQRDIVAAVSVAASLSNSRSFGIWFVCEEDIQVRTSVACQNG